MKNFALIVLTAVFVVLTSCAKQNESLLENENVLLQKKNDSLNRKLEVAQEAIVVLQDKNAWYDPEYDNVDFKKKGIVDPEKFIKEELTKRTDLIPLQPTLGGNMSFGNIQLLGSKYLIADYGDGHVEGKSIFSYKLNDSGRLEFKLVGFEEN
ncbi:hypothetical protein [Flavobacterium chungbukense]|uniref:Lipoprotein n=1 Tax=Flavobacterium chungbukense TaxID=877464 RepID=A0ABP7YN13_9FLAO|nr:hypothetical protein [Flavobacterium chungbukense]MCC4919781.1 hypothetical protein [Flavobacterium chungbukense]